MKLHEAQILRANKHFVSTFELKPNNWMVRLTIQVGATSIDILSGNFEEINVVLLALRKVMKGA